MGIIVKMAVVYRIIDPRKCRNFETRLRFAGSNYLHSIFLIVELHFIVGPKTMIRLVRVFVFNARLELCHHATLDCYGLGDRFGRLE